MVDSNRNFALTLLKKQFKDLNNSTDSMFSVGIDEDNFFKWTVMFEGSQDTLYEGAILNVSLEFPEDYPNMPPVMKFKTEMWHPNIYQDGTVCISILHPPIKDEMNSQEKEDEKWRPVLGPQQILLSVISMLNDPNINSPANVDAAIQFRDNKDAYKKKVRELVRKSVEC